MGRLLGKIRFKSQKRKVKNTCSMHTRLHTLSEIPTLLLEEACLSLTSGKTRFHLSVFALSEILSTECKDGIRFSQNQDYLFRNQVITFPAILCVEISFLSSLVFAALQANGHITLAIIQTYFRPCQIQEKFCVLGDYL